MSDFLTSLVARSFGTAPVIRPRITSLFEPVRGETAALRNAFGGRDEETIMAQEEVIAQESGNRRSQAPPKMPSRPDDAHRMIPNRDEIAESPLAISAPRSSSQPDAEDRLITGGTENAEPELRMSEKLPVPMVNVPAVKRESTNDDKPILLIPPRVAPASVEVERIVRRTEDSSISGASGPSVGDRVGTKDELGQLIPPRLPAELRISDLAFSARPERRQRGEMRGFAPSASAAEPTVQVTIGRIEVRASKENARSSRATAASPVMSLDEYLRKRVQRVGS